MTFNVGIYDIDAVEGKQGFLSDVVAVRDFLSEHVLSLRVARKGIYLIKNMNLTGGHRSMLWRVSFLTRFIP